MTYEENARPTRHRRMAGTCVLGQMALDGSQLADWMHKMQEERIPWENIFLYRWRCKVCGFVSWKFDREKEAVKYDDAKARLGHRKMVENKSGVVGSKS